MGTLGLAVVSIEFVVENASLERFALVAAAGILFYAIFFGKPLFEEDGFHPRALRLLTFGVVSLLLIVSSWLALRVGGPEATAYTQLLTMPIMVLVYQGFYQTRLLHGGADAKAMITITLLVPTYPDASPFPIFVMGQRVEAAMRVLFPFSLVVLVDTAILFLAIPVGTLLYNLIRGDLKFPQALFGYRADLEALPPHTWLMEQIDERGRHRLVLFPKRGRDQTAKIERLRQAGVKRPWVQPKIPFMVPLMAGYVLAFVLGNIILVLFPR